MKEVTVKNGQQMWVQTSKYFFLYFILFLYFPHFEHYVRNVFGNKNILKWDILGDAESEDGENSAE